MRSCHLIKKKNKEENIITIEPDANITRYGTRDSTLTSYTTLESLGTKLSNDGSGVTIGSGVSKVKISFQLAVNTTGTNHTLNAQVCVNSTNISRLVMDTKQAVSGRCFVSCVDNLYSVTQGDKIQIGWYGQSGDTLYKNQTFLTVEVVA